MVPELARFLLCVLACYRLSKMIADDDGPAFIFKRFRYWIRDKSWMEADVNRAINRLDGLEIDDRWYGKWHNLAEGIECPYCLGVWFSLPLLALYLFPSISGDIFLLLMGISGGQAFMQSLKVQK